MRHVSILLWRDSTSGRFKKEKERERSKSKHWLMWLRVKRRQTNDWLRDRKRWVMASVGLREVVKLPNRFSQTTFLTFLSLNHCLLSVHLVECGTIVVLLVLGWKIHPSMHKHTRRQCHIKSTEPWQYSWVNSLVLSLTLSHTSFALKHRLLLTIICL